MTHLQPNLEIMSYGITLATCDTTAANILQSLLCDLPTAFDTVLCSIEDCERSELTQTPITIFMYNSNNNKLDGLQQFIDRRLSTEVSKCGYVKDHNNPCNGQKTTTVRESNMHLFIEILNWQGKI